MNDNSDEYKQMVKHVRIYRYLCWFMGTVMISRSIFDLWTQ